MQEVFIGREKELNDLNTLYRQDKSLRKESKVVQTKKQY